MFPCEVCTFSPQCKGIVCVNCNGLLTSYCPASSSKARADSYQQRIHAPWRSIPAINWQHHVAHTWRNTANYISSMSVLLCISLCCWKHIHEHLTHQKQCYLCSSRIEWEAGSPGNHTAITWTWRTNAETSWDRSASLGIVRILSPNHPSFGIKSVLQCNSHNYPTMLQGSWRAAT